MKGGKAQNRRLFIPNQLYITGGRYWTRTSDPYRVNQRKGLTLPCIDVNNPHFTGISSTSLDGENGTDALLS